jgi:Protein of unknown function with PCYCGC motif
LIAALASFILGTVAVIVVRHDRFLAERDGWRNVPWDQSWPALPLISGAAAVGSDVARMLYAFAGRNPHILGQIPCFCGCRLQGHRSNHDCYVAHRSGTGEVVEWNSHGLTCPLGHNITGDVMIRHHRGVPLAAIREDINREFGPRGTPTPTPHPPVQ